MNRREFFKTSGSSIVTIALFPAISVISESTKPIKRNKEYWKQYFRSTTQEANLVQMNKHTDIQIDNLPNKSGPYMVFRILCKGNEEMVWSTPFLKKLVCTPILLEV